MTMTDDPIIGADGQELEIGQRVEVASGSWQECVGRITSRDVQQPGVVWVELNDYGSKPFPARMLRRVGG